MGMTATYRLVPKIAKDFPTAQRARIEALRALAVWQARQEGRRFAIVECRDNVVLERLTWRDADGDAAADLDLTCGVRRLALRQAQQG